MTEEMRYSEVSARLDEIVAEVKRKDLSLAQSLDLLNEAITLGNKAIDLVDIPEQPSDAEDEADESGAGSAISPDQARQDAAQE